MGTIESNTRTSSDRVQERSGIKGISFIPVKEQKEKWQLGGDKKTWWFNSRARNNGKLIIVSEEHCKTAQSNPRWVEV